VKRAERAAAEAQEEILKKRSRQEYMKAQMELARATSRLKVSKLRK
jgi:F0F1-type ATP synthase epsilon subunit